MMNTARTTRVLARILSILLVPGLAVPFATAAEYHVSPAGDDAASGAREAPWQSLAKVSHAAKAGDTIVFFAGDYDGTLAPENSGAEGSPIVFRSEKPLAARFVGGHPAVELKGREHIVVDGLHVEPENGACFDAEDCRHLTIQNCTMEGGRRSYVMVGFKRCDTVVLRHNLFQRNLNLGGEGGKTKTVLFGHSVDIAHSRHFLVEDNRFGKAGHCPFAFSTNNENSIVRHNLFFADWGRAMALGRNSKHVLFEENVVVGAMNSAGSARPASPLQGSFLIVRRNLVVRNFGLPLTNGFYMKNQTPVSDILDDRFYHNTVCNNLEGAWAVLSFVPSVPAGIFERNLWQNNLFSHNDHAGDFLAVEFLNLPPGNRFASNLVFGDQPGRKTIRYVNAKKPEDNGRYTLAAFEQRFPEVFARSIEADPRLVDPDADDYRLGAGSPAIDAGDFLARALADGAGRQLAVDDSRCFHDGFGIPGEKGDLLFVGPDKTIARVIAVDHDKGLLTLDRDITWKAGDPVNTPYAGKAPDLGAMEFGAESEPWYQRLVVPAGSYFQPSGDGATPLLANDFEDASVENWGHMWNLERRHQTSIDRDDSTSATGKYSFKVLALGDGATLALDTEAYLWELDAFPYVTFSYRIPPGVPVGVWLRPFEFAGQTLPAQTRVGGSPALAKPAEPGVANHELIDDDRWHTISIDARAIRQAYPGLRYLRAFDFGNSREKQRGYARKGDAFWFDDFSIAGLPPTAVSSTDAPRANHHSP